MDKHTPCKYAPDGRFCDRTINTELIAALEQIERLSRTADGKLVNVPAMIGDIARAALSKARGASLDTDDVVECSACFGKGFNDVRCQVAERASDMQDFRETCEACDGTGKIKARGEQV